jgi:hypothetical protein
VPECFASICHPPDSGGPTRINNALKTPQLTGCAAGHANNEYQRTLRLAEGAHHHPWRVVPFTLGRVIYSCQAIFTLQQPPQPNSSLHIDPSSTGLCGLAGGTCPAMGPGNPCKSGSLDVISRPGCSQLSANGTMKNLIFTKTANAQA